MRAAVLAVLLAACDTSTDMYVVTREIYPTTVTIAVQADGVDLDDDGFNDNRIGILLATFYVIGHDPSDDVQGRIDRGELTQRIEVVSTDDTASSAMPVGGVTFAFYDELVTFELIGARMRIDDRFAARLIGSIAGGLRRADVDAKLPAPFARYLEQVVASQCTMRTVPGCGCAALGDYDARYWLAGFDASGDCTITADEIVASELANEALFSDVTLDGEPVLSFGLRVEAAPE